MSDLGRWLGERGLSQYAAAFADNDIELDVLPQLTDQDLKYLGLSLGHRGGGTAPARAAARRGNALPSVYAAHLAEARCRSRHA